MFKNIPFKRTMLASMLTLASGAVTALHNITRSRRRSAEAGC